MDKKIDVNQWRAMFREVGLDESRMARWHKVFERENPESHKSFLEWLGLSPQDIEKVRASSR